MTHSRSRAQRGLALVCLALLSGLWALSVAAADNTTVRFRLEGDKDNVAIDVPYAVIEFVSKHQTNRDLNLGDFHGQKVHVSLDQIMKVLQEQKQKNADVLLFKLEEEGKTTTCTLGIGKDGTRPGKTPVNVVLTSTKPGEASPTKLTVPIGTVETLFGAVTTGGDKKNDQIAFFKDLLAFGKQLGTGLLARVTSADGEVTLALE